MEKILFLFALVILAGVISINDVFADHTEVTIIPASGSGAPGCEETSQGCFIPKEATVDVGGKVIFSNTDTAAHTFTAGIAGGPSGVFDSSLVMAGSSYEWTPTTAGKVTYFCMVHPWMVGLILVEEGTYIPPTDADKGIFGFLGGGGGQGGLPSEPLRQNPTEEAEYIVEKYYSESGSYLRISPDDTQRIADLMNEYISKIRERLPKEAIMESTYLSSSNEKLFDSVLVKAGLEGEFYSSYVSLWKDIAKDKLEMLDSLETKSKNQIRNLEIDDSFKESYISKITQMTNIRKNEWSDGMAKIITPLEQKSNSNSAQNEIRDEILGSSKVQSGGCLIATATYGSELAPQVQQLRELRDNSLLQTTSGTSFMSSFNDFYYSFSPTIADWERENPAFKEVVKIVITPMISSLSILNYVDMDSEVNVLGYGISLILLNVGMYFVAPGIVIVGIKKTRDNWCTEKNLENKQKRVVQS